MKNHSLCRVLTINLFNLFWVAAASAQSLNYVSVDYPGAIRTRAWGISPGGVIVGDYLDSAHTSHGFLLSNEQYVTIDVPGSLFGLSGLLPTSIRGISPGGDVVGDFFAPPGSSPECTTSGTPPCIKGFLLHRGSFSTVLFPGQPGSIPQRITPNGTIYGCYHDQDLMKSMFSFARTASGTFSSIDVPASMHSGATPDGSPIVGLWSDLTIMPAPTHGYVIQNGNFQSFDVPGSTFTQAWDISPAGNIVGDFKDGAGIFHGFIRTAGGYASVDFPAAVATHAWGTNPGGAIVGMYTDANGRSHGYLAVPAAAD